MRERDRLSKWTAIVAGVGAIVAALFVLTSYLPGAPIVSRAVGFVLFALAIGVVIVVAVSTRLGRPCRPPFPGLPRTAGRVVFCGAVAMALIAGLSLAQLHGDPTIHNGRYYFDDHGQLTRTTAAGYRHGLSLDERIFGGGACLLCGAVCAFSAFAVPRRAARWTLD